MYEIIKYGYNKLLSQKNFTLYNIDSDVWLSLNGNKLWIVKDGIIFEDEIKLWEELDSNYINILCSKIYNSTHYNLKMFLRYLHNNKDNKADTIISEEEAYRVLEKCRKDIDKINEQLKFYDKVFNSCSKIEELLT